MPQHSFKKEDEEQGIEETSNLPPSHPSSINYCNDTSLSTTKNVLKNE